MTSLQSGTVSLACTIIVYTSLGVGTVYCDVILHYIIMMSLQRPVHWDGEGDPEGDREWYREVRTAAAGLPAGTSQGGRREIASREPPSPPPPLSSVDLI